MRQHLVSQGTLGILAALLSITLVLGSLSMSLAEAGTFLSMAPTASPSTSPTPQPSATVTISTLPATSMVTPAISPTPSATATITPIPTLPPPPTNCPPPADWVLIEVQPGDSLESLAQTYDTTASRLAQANCLVVETLLPGTTLYVPRPPTPTPLPSPVCGPPPGWVPYIVQPGDTLYGLSQTFGVSVYQLQQANCLGSSTRIQAGARLFVPFLPVRTSTPTRTATQAPPASATATIPFTPTATTYFPPASATHTATSTATRTPTATPTHTNVPTATPTATATATPTATPTDVPTSTPTPTNVPTETATASPTTAVR